MRRTDIFMIDSIFQSARNFLTNRYPIIFERVNPNISTSTFFTRKFSETNTLLSSGRSINHKRFHRQ